ncbi:hypothetical protein CSOJ01_03364 [Colletotrichum sojae]|uniref:Uncharacterized protein n=1 Tax=Colletotrichum sojae TaxID=2175907 RepID=A0A8H6JM04_9PEZI|nr:hypothetical protein CSOJ01_03364 [Colletotrichum sojae]
MRGRSKDQILPERNTTLKVKFASAAWLVLRRYGLPGTTWRRRSRERRPPGHDVSAVVVRTRGGAAVRPVARFAEKSGLRRTTFSKTGMRRGRAS